MHESLLLKNEYIKDVKVYDNTSVYAGVLTLKPNECYLEISTERETSENFYASKKIECYCNDGSYLLYGLKLLQMSHTFLEAQENDIICSVSIKFEIQYVLFINGFLPSLDTKINSFAINTDFIKKWTLQTETQNQILINYIKNEGYSSYYATEFEQHINNYGKVGVYYLPSQFTSIEELNSGIKIHPQLKISFEEKLDFSKLFNEFNDLYQLLTVFNGGDFQIDSIEFEIDEWNSKTAYLYYPSSHNYEDLNYVLLPLGKDLIFNDQGLKQLPLVFFDNYYNLTANKMDIFKKYLRYKQLSSLEEKFLGYFRLLEKLVAKKESFVDDRELAILLKRSKSYLIKKLNTKKKIIESLNDRIKYANTLKLNIERCIGDFYETIPQDIRNHLEFNKEDLKDIVDLRNNITHAKDYSIKDYELYNYTVFIHSLLFLGITNLLLEIPFETCIPIARRLRQI
ncbi:HEPN domain-containing protein [Acinetobacter nosocomialis]|uniref:HEPN domain-containing protein n=1 Tax=Acinetobacter nosocomialis TaxID=106654 RepID=UPI003985863F